MLNIHFFILLCYQKFTTQEIPERIDYGRYFVQLASQNMWTWLKSEEKIVLDSFLDEKTRN